jgi:hypothetical protein
MISSITYHFDGLVNDNFLLLYDGRHVVPPETLADAHQRQRQYEVLLRHFSH